MGQISVEIGVQATPYRRSLKKEERRGLRFPRYFTAKLAAGRTPYDEVRWERRTASIGNDKGAIIFEQKDIEVPADWSQTATNIVASKYFHGRMGSPERESSVSQIIHRVVDTITEWGINDRYFSSLDDAENFRSELAHLTLNQKACFNSPVWFNVGVKEENRGYGWYYDEATESIRKMDRTLHRNARRASSTRYRTRWCRSSTSPKPRACCSSGARGRARICRRCARKTVCCGAAAGPAGR
jgi:ribonucleoside-diphosphate reductase alpha chain